ncbi:MAG TPA: hypothetical protein VM055_07660 [Novosphingobium sp.]|nr:hypothetical protein [Novosphingobium sp.]
MAKGAIAAALAAQPLAAQPTPAPPRLTPERQAALTCAAAFAIVASGQARGEQAALAFPSLAVRGREFFVRFGAATIDATGASREAVRAMLEGEVARFQREAAAGGDPDATVAAVMPACLTRLDAEVPPLPKPSLAQCAAMLALAYEEVHSREGLSASARDLKTLAAVLESREREALTGEGITGDAADRRLAESHDAMLQESLATPAGVEKYELATCYELAKPKDGGHY